MSQLGPVASAVAEPIPHRVVEVIEQLTRLPVNKEQDYERIEFPGKKITAFHVRAKSLDPYRKGISYIVGLVVHIFLPKKSRVAN